MSCSLLWKPLLRRTQTDAHVSIRRVNDHLRDCHRDQDSHGEERNGSGEEGLGEAGHRDPAMDRSALEMNALPPASIQAAMQSAHAANTPGASHFCPLTRNRA